MRLQERGLYPLPTSSARSNSPRNPEDAESDSESGDGDYEHGGRLPTHSQPDSSDSSHCNLAIAGAQPLGTTAGGGRDWTGPALTSTKGSLKFSMTTVFNVVPR